MNGHLGNLKTICLLVFLCQVSIHLWNRLLDSVENFSYWNDYFRSCLLASTKYATYNNITFSFTPLTFIDLTFVIFILPSSSFLMVIIILGFGKQVLIFSQWTKILDIMHYYFSEKGMEVCRIDGSVKLEDRRRQIQDFNDVESEFRVFLLSTRAGGLGINLTAADTCILYDSDWVSH